MKAPFSSKDEFIKQSLHLVHFVAKRFLKRTYTSHVDYDDLYSAGCVGLVKAYNGFDPSKGFQFSTYATPMISGEIQRYIRDNGKALRVPRSEYELSAKIRWAKMEDKSAAEIALYFECSIKLAKRTLESIQLQVLSTDYPIHAGVDDRPLGDFIPVSDDCTSIFVEEFLQSLTDREQTIVRYRMHGRSQREAGQACGVSQAQACRDLRCIGKKVLQFVGVN
ncbi:MAG: sigma-70 family RNA polymerase sigma factor [Paenibacillaceae bacterium]